MAYTIIDLLLETYEGEPSICWPLGGRLEEVTATADLEALRSIASALAQGVIQLAHEQGLLSDQH